MVLVTAWSNGRANIQLKNRKSATKALVFPCELSFCRSIFEILGADRQNSKRRGALGGCCGSVATLFLCTDSHG